VHPVFDGIRVIEVAEWTFVPAAAAVLAEFGADVIKVERPEGGDAQRGLAVAGVSPIHNGVALQMEQANRGGKRSVGIDIRTEQGRELIYKLVRDADVFLTSLLPGARRRYGLDIDDIRKVNPGIVYGLGSGYGSRGPESDQAGYDMTAFWCRGGLAYNLTDDDSQGIVKLRPGVGDRVSAMNLVAGVSAALLRKVRTGEGAVVEVSLLGSAMWQIAGDIVYSKSLGIENSKVSRGRNPLCAYYRTSDGKWLALALLESDRWWPGFVQATGLSYLLDDPRFRDHFARDEHYEECSDVLTEVFAADPMDVWRKRLANFSGPWAPVQSSLELAEDVQVKENGYLPTTRTVNGQEVSLVAAPVSFDGTPRRFGPCPDPGADTDTVLLELGESWEQIIEYKISGAVL
jgi:crotonobetainyl-CoA:carnitine CoA-transferase CaiB-like acyl-CoA transferase